MPGRAAIPQPVAASTRMALVPMSALALGLLYSACGGDGAVEPPEDVAILVSRTTVSFAAVEGDALPAGTEVVVTGSNDAPLGPLTIEVVHPLDAERTDWLSHTIAGNELVLRPATTDVYPRTYTATVRVHAQDADITPASIAVTYAVAGLPRDLQILANGAGSATIATTVAGAMCTIVFGQPDAGCARSLPFGTQLTLTVTSTNGSTFEGWSGGCTGTGTCTLTMDDDRAVTALLAPPPSGGDLLVFGDAALFGATAMENPGNVRLVRNLIDFSGTGARAGGTVVARYCGAQIDVTDARCASDWAAFDAEVAAMGYSRVVDIPTSGDDEPIAPDVKVLMYVQFCAGYTAAQANMLRAFAAEGGRIVYVGDDNASLPLKCSPNRFPLGLGANVTLVRGSVGCGGVLLSSASLRPHLITAGVQDLEVDCASELVPGSAATALFYDASGTRALGVASPVNTTPLSEEEGIAWDAGQNTQGDLRPTPTGTLRPTRRGGG